MKAEEFDGRFDAGEDMSAALDTARARRPCEEHAASMSTSRHG
jgi:hypothetical protein